MGCFKSFDRIALILIEVVQVVCVLFHAELVVCVLFHAFVFLFVLCCFGLFRAVALVMLSRVFLSCFNLFSVLFWWFLLCHVVQSCVGSLCWVVDGCVTPFSIVLGCCRCFKKVSVAF